MNSRSLSYTLLALALLPLLPSCQSSSSNKALYRPQPEVLVSIYQEAAQARDKGDDARLRSQAARAGIAEYHETIMKATRRDQAALLSLLAFQPSGDARQTHGRYLYRLLLGWGDKEFEAALLKLQPGQAEKALELIDWWSRL